MRDPVSGKCITDVTHPDRHLRVIWFGPRLNNGKAPNEYGPAFGNIAFNLPAHFLENLLINDYKCYWIENFEFGTILASR